MNIKHPAYWAESGTGDERSQYQYWLSIRLRDEYEVLNKGYGRDTSTLLLARFQKELTPLNAQYCIIQIGTNDIFEAQKFGKDDQKVLDSYIGSLKSNILQMIQVCKSLNIIPMVGNLLPRTGFKGIYRQGLWDFNAWLENYCNTTEGVLFVDFYNAGKNNIPPTPLEDPNDAGSMNPIYDGDTQYDEHGNVIVRGNGIHPDIQGYKLMGEAVPLHYFRTAQDGLKLYVDENCTIEEVLDSTSTVQRIYKIKIANIIRGREKSTIRYVKNIGRDQLIYAAYPITKKGIAVKFKIDDGKFNDIGNGILLPSGKHRLEIAVEAPMLGEEPELYLGLINRVMEQKIY